MDNIFQYTGTKTKRSESSISSDAIPRCPALPSVRRASRTSSAVSNTADEVCNASATRSPIALPYAARVTKARRIRLYRNGDVYYGGMVVVLAPDNFRTFDSLLSYINRSPLADPSVLKKVGSAALRS